MQKHIPVLLREVLDIFAPVCVANADNNPVIIDCTLGLGGHTLEFLREFPSLEIIAIDKDVQAIDIATAYAKEAGLSQRLHTINAPFSIGVERAFELAKSLDRRIVGVLADIGVSSMQLDSSERGFGFGSHTLDMRMDLAQSKDAKYVINTYSEFELGRVLREYGEIKEYKKLAKSIKARIKSSGDFESAREFSEFLRSHSSHKGGKIHPATLAFQAVRMEVNNELNELKNALFALENQSNAMSGARVGIISFHSLEDRIVKETFRQWARPCVCEASAMKCVCGGDNAKGEILTKKPLIASAKEVSTNPRSRSAKLRAFAFRQ